MCLLGVEACLRCDSDRICDRDHILRLTPYLALSLLRLQTGFLSVLSFSTDGRKDFYGLHGRESVLRFGFSSLHIQRCFRSNQN